MFKIQLIQENFGICHLLAFAHKISIKFKNQNWILLISELGSENSNAFFILINILTIPKPHFE